jgi:hypothetical protein
MLVSVALVDGPMRKVVVIGWTIGRDLEQFGHVPEVADDSNVDSGVRCYLKITN